MDGRRVNVYIIYNISYALLYKQARAYDGFLRQIVRIYTLTLYVGTTFTLYYNVYVRIYVPKLKISTQIVIPVHEVLCTRRQDKTLSGV